MSISFNSKKNYEILKELINSSLEDKYGKNKTSSIWNKEYEDGIKETMNYVESKVSKEILRTMSEEDYLYLMNKKVYNIITPLIEESIKGNKIENKIENIKGNKYDDLQYGRIGENNTNEINKMQQEYERLKMLEQETKQQKRVTFHNDRTNVRLNNTNNNRIEPSTRGERVDPMFDPELLKTYDNDIPVIEYPKLSEEGKLKQSNMDERLLEYNMARDEMNPRPQFETPFQTKKIEKEKDNRNLMKSYKAKLRDYEDQVSSMNNFDKTQNKFNNLVEKKLDKRAPYEAIPINLFGNDYDIGLGMNFEKYKNDKNKKNKNKSMVSEEEENIEGENLQEEENIEEEKQNEDEDENENINVDDLNDDEFAYYNNNSKETDIKNLYNDVFQRDGLSRKNNITLNAKNEINRTNNNNNLNFSPYVNNSLSTFILPPKTNNIEKKYRVVVNSVDRNKALFPDQNRFEIKFNPSSNSYRIDTYFDSLGKLIYAGREIVKGDDEGATIPITFDNIKQVSLLSVLAPVITYYKGGRAPVIYNASRPATGQTSDFEQYNPISTASTGIAQGVFKEPCLYLVVPELEHSFYSTDQVGNRAFSKLIPDFASNTGFISVYTSTFTFLTPDDRADFYLYDPTTRGKIDKITPTIYNFRGQEFDFGIDKLYVESFEEASDRYSGYCGNEYVTTKLNVKSTDDNYEDYCSKFSVYKQHCNTLNSLPCVPGDLIYFYNTLPVEEDIIYLEPYIEVIDFDIIDTDTVKLIAGYKEEGTEIKINFRDFIPGGNSNTFKIYNQYYIALQQRVPGHVGMKVYYFRITGFNGEGVLLKRTKVFDNKIKMNLINRIGFVKNNPQGLQTTDPKSLFYRNGFYIYRVGNFQINNQINTENVDQFLLFTEYPWQYFKQYLESISDDYEYQSGDIFFVQHKLQLIYEFEVTVETKDNVDLKSNLEGTGLNF